MELYWGATLGFRLCDCSLVLTKSMGKTHVTPMMPAMPPLMILGNKLKSTQQQLLNMLLKCALHM